jgi:hypothetical protein
MTRQRGLTETECLEYHHILTDEPERRRKAMAGPPRDPEPGDDPGVGPGRGPVGMPRWVKVFLVIIVVLVLALIVSQFLGIQHGPGRHNPGALVATRLR